MVQWVSTLSLVLCTIVLASRLWTPSLGRFVYPLVCVLVPLGKWDNSSRLVEPDFSLLGTRCKPTDYLCVTITCLSRALFVDYRPLSDILSYHSPPSPSLFSLYLSSNNNSFNFVLGLISLSWVSSLVFPIRISPDRFPLFLKFRRVCSFTPAKLIFP